MMVTGIILAGGKSSRMGEDKGLVLYKGVPMIQYVIDVLEKVVSSVIIISNNSEYQKFGKPVYADLIKDKGPVGGIYTGLHYTETDMNICVSCDVPFISVELLHLLLKNSGESLVTVPEYKGKLHPLIGVYKKSTLDKFKESTVNNHLKLREVIHELSGKVVEIDKNIFNEDLFRNINTRTELKKIEHEC